MTFLPSGVRILARKPEVLFLLRFVPSSVLFILCVTLLEDFYKKVTIGYFNIYSLKYFGNKGLNKQGALMLRFRQQKSCQILKLAIDTHPT